jgi:hypothetical protein
MPKRFLDYTLLVFRVLPNIVSLVVQSILETVELWHV